MLGRWMERLRTADGVYTAGSWALWFVDRLLLPGVIGGLVIWAATQAGWFWNAYGWLGAVLLGIAAALAVSLTLFLSAIGMRALRGSPASVMAPAKADQLEILEGKDFSGQTVRIDGNHFINCTFKRCTVRYDGGPMKFTHCHFSRGNDRVTFTTINTGIATTMQLIQAIGLMREDAQGTIIEIDQKDIERVFKRSGG